MQHTQEKEKNQVIRLLLLQRNGLNTLYAAEGLPKEYICSALRIVTGMYCASVSGTRTDTEGNLTRTSPVWKCVPGPQTTEADSDLGSNRRPMLSQGWTNCSWTNSPTYYGTNRHRFKISHVCLQLQAIFPTRTDLWGPIQNVTDHVHFSSPPSSSCTEYHC